MSSPALRRSLLDRLDGGSRVIHAGGYLFEMERRGYLQAGAYVPEVVLEHPEVVEQLTREFMRSGSDVVLAFTYYGHREKLRLIGKEHLLEPLNREAMRIARRVQADFPAALLAGNICNTNIYDPEDKASLTAVRDMLAEGVAWAKEGGAEFIVAETYAWTGEARIAVEVCREAGLPIVVGLAIHKEGVTREGHTPAEACELLFKDAGAEVVGVNCHRGPATLLPLVQDITARVPAQRVAGWAVGYRTTPEQPTFGALRDPDASRPDLLPHGMPFPTGLDPFTATRWDFWDFAEGMVRSGAGYLGTCCGAGPHHVRAIAEALGRTTEASRYSADMSKHYSLGSAETLKAKNQAYRSEL